MKIGRYVISRRIRGNIRKEKVFRKALTDTPIGYMIHMLKRGASGRLFRRMFR